MAIRKKEENRVKKVRMQSREIAEFFQPSEISRLSGGEIIRRLLEGRYPQEIIRGLSNQDFLWLVKKVGDDDSLPLLALGSLDQWRHLIDLEMWNRDRLDIGRTTEWLKRFHDADPRRLISWFFSEGQYLAYNYFYRLLEVIIVDPDQDDVPEIPEEFFTLDGAFYVKVNDEESLPVIRDILQRMMDLDSERYYWFLLSLGGVVPAETEEEMYRLRNVRIAEEGFLPFEEALEVYVPFDPALLKSGGGTPTIEANDNKSEGAVPSFLPFFHAGEGNMLMKVACRSPQFPLMDRLYFEFAGLCNQIHIADGIAEFDHESLVKTCRKAGGYINLALEKQTGGDIAVAENLVRANTLSSIFRAGFGLAMKLKWEFDQLVRESWYARAGLPHSFWGIPWGKVAEGLKARRPRYCADADAAEPFRDFESLSEWEECRDRVKELASLDSAFERLDHIIPLDRSFLGSGEMTFQPLFITFWARKRLEIDPGYEPISLEDAKIFLEALRECDKNPPYRMDGFDKEFVGDFMEYAPDLDPVGKTALESALLQVWCDFKEEYADIASVDLDPRYSKLIMIEE